MEGEYTMGNGSLILADIDLMTVVWWLLVGLIAGALASFVMRGGGYGIVGDIVVGLIGAFVGGFLMSLFGLGATGLVGTIIVAFLGACVFIALLRLFTGGFSRRNVP
jgi:uncharacterized membrane protein YeaQ/YmgE (transglycosylase-associated protein family)